MQSTLEKYRLDIQSGKINPAVRWDGQSKTIFDPSDPASPLDYLGFGVYNLQQNPSDLATGENEYILIPVCGDFEITVGEKTFAGSRPGGPFTTEPENSKTGSFRLF